MNAVPGAVALLALASASAQAQAAPAFIGTGGDFLASSFCRQAAQCARLGSIDLGRTPARAAMTEEYFRVTPKVRQPLGQSSYTVIVTRFGGKVSRVALRYLPHQDLPENGDVARALMGFATGASFKGQELYNTSCETYVKNGNRFFIVQPPVRLNLSGVNEAIISVSDTPAGSMTGVFTGKAAVQLRQASSCPQPARR